MIIAINAGHTLSGAGSGADYDCFNESKINRAIANEVIKQLKVKGHTVINATVNKAETQNAYLKETCRIANSSHAELFISFHCNVSADHKGSGVEAYTYKGRQLVVAVNVCKELSRLGFKNRGVKDGSNLYVIKNTSMPAILVEVCFIDNQADRALFSYNGIKGITEAILKAIK